MIRAAVKAVTTSNPIQDYLGGDPPEYGVLRVGTYPEVQVVFYDDEIGDHQNPEAVLGGKHYVIRPRAALETMDDVAVQVQRDIDRMLHLQKYPLLDDDEVVGLVESAESVKEFETLIGQEIKLPE